MQDDFLNKLNEEQKAAVEHTTGPLLIVAGAGTGKTRVITSRILKLIADGKAKSNEVLALTFTEKAAEEMTERVDVAMPLGYEEIWIKTFHGFCEKVLRESGHEIGLSRGYRLLAKLDQWMFMKKHLFEFDLDYFRPLGNPASFIDTLVTHFSRIKEEFITPDEYVDYANRKLSELMEKAKKSEQTKIDKKSVLGIEMEEVRKILEAARAYKKYQELMTAENCLDFGDLSYYVLKLFEERPSVLKYYQERFKYILVDEFQDTNYAQFKLLLMLAGGGGLDGSGAGSTHRNICVVGDDDQSIFRWRGASLSNILQFNEHFSDAEKIILTQNYRSNQNILDASHYFIKFNDPNRLEHREKISKNLKSQSKEKISINNYHFEDYSDEVGFVIGQIKKLNTASKDPVPFGEIAILVRATAHAIPFADELKKVGIPFQIKTPKGLLSLDEIKDIVAVIRGSSDKTNDVAWLRLLKIGVFGIKMNDILDILKKTKKDDVHISDVIQEFKDTAVLPGMESPLTKFVNFMDDLIEGSKNRSTSEVVSYFLTKSGYMSELSNNFNQENQQKLDNITNFSRIVWQFEKNNENNSVIEFSEFLYLIEESNIPLAEESNLSANDVDAVQILTTHGAKGLEFDTVFVVNLVNGRFPILNRRDPLHIPLELTKEIFPEGDYHVEEERRLFYVALTRAKRRLHLTYSDKYFGPKKWKRSQFLDEIEESKLITNKDGKKSSVDLKSDLVSPINTIPKKWIDGRSFSYSQINTFKMCPLKYGYRYALGVPSPMGHAANFGTSIHETLKDFYRIMMKDENAATLDLLFELFEKNWIGVGYEGKDHEVERKKQGKKMLEEFYKTNNNPWVVPAFIEKNFNLKIGDYMMNGRIDRIDKLPDGSYEVIDYKTGKSRALTPDQKLQLYVYALACRDILGITASKLSFYFLEDGEKMSVSKGYDDLDGIKSDLSAYITQIKESDFAPTPGYYCKFCDYGLICPAV